MRTLTRLAVFLALSATVAGQGLVVPSPKFIAFDANGDPCNLCRLYVYAAGTDTPATVYSNVGLTTPHANPVVMDSAGRATIYSSPSASYKYTLKTSADVDIWSVDNVTGGSSGVLSLTAASTRALQISRAGAAAGMSIASTGGSGKTFGFESTTSGELKIQDDADGTPRFQIGVGDAISAVTTGTFTVSGGLFAATGFGTHQFLAGGTTGNILSLRNTTAGTGNYAQLQVGNDLAANALHLNALSSTYTTATFNVAGGAAVVSTGVGGLSIAATDAAGDVRIYTGGSATPALTIDQDGIATFTGVPSFAGAKFLAYNSADDSGTSDTVVDFNTEVFDTANAFSADTFTAPVTGYYNLCAGVALDATNANAATTRIVTSNRTYLLRRGNGVTEGHSGCVLADMDAADTARVFINPGVGQTYIIDGGFDADSSMVTWFSGHYVP
jgi:hypothetical protein